MKKILAFFMILVFTMSMTTGCFAAESVTEENHTQDFLLTMQVGNPMMTVNGTESEIDPGRGTVPIIQNDRTLVPVRAIIEAMGGSVNWDEETQTALLELEGDIITLVLGSTTAYFNETASILDVAPVSINDRTMLPIRYIAESFGFTVGWDGKTQTITIAKVAQPDTKPTTPPETPQGKTLVVYYSATGTTEKVANTIAETLNADLFEIEPVEPYTDADLDWTDESSRVSREHNDERLRDIELVSAEVPDWETYDNVFIGYPIWWGIAAWPVNNFVKVNDFSNKTVIPFCTSSSSGIGESGELLEALVNNGNWLDGRRLRSDVTTVDIETWVEEMQLTVKDDETAQSNTLVVYFSMPETTDPDNMTEEEANSTVVIDGEVLGNTQYMAKVIAENTNADIFRIEPEIPYPTDHDTLVDLAADEQNNNARPAIKDQIENLADYDTVFLGYPNWWGDMPMILYSFLEQYDLSGKTVIPFNTHGGSGFSSTINTIRTLEPNANVLEGLSISRNKIQDAEPEIAEWVNGLDIK